MVEHLGNRPVLNMDQLAEMTDLRPRLEKEMRLPGDKRGAKNRIYFFSVDGRLRGNVFTGCLLAGECIMVQSDRGFEHALRQAKDGLADTLELAREYLEETNRPVIDTSPMSAAHLTVDVGGRRGAGPHDQPLATDPKLRDIIANIIGGEKWRG